MGDTTSGFDMSTGKEEATEEHRCFICNLPSLDPIAIRKSYLMMTGNVPTSFKDEIWLCTRHFREYEAEIRADKVMLDESGYWLVNGARAVVRKPY